MSHADSDAEMVCPHCQAKGSVTTKAIKRDGSLSLAKATVAAPIAICTIGLAAPLLSVHHRQKLTQAHCAKCGATWTFRTNHQRERRGAVTGVLLEDPLHVAQSLADA